MPFCLQQQDAEKIKQAIRSGKLNPAKLVEMTSQQRRAFLADLVGTENAKEVNLAFEKKLLLVNQEKAMYDWAKDITGMSKEAKEATLQKIRDTYAEKKRRVYSPAENEKFLNEIVSDVYSKKFKTEVTLEEAQTITELSQDFKKAKAKTGDVTKWKTEDFVQTGSKEDAILRGATETALNNYIGGLKAEANKVLFINPFKVRGLMEKARAVSVDAKISLKFIAQNARSVKASVDNSLWGRQGIKAFFTHPTIWAKNFSKSFVDIGQVMKTGNKAGDAIIDAEKAEIYSRENYAKGRYERGEKLDIGIKEEEFPTSAPSKIPALGRLFKAAEVAYEAGAMRLRSDIADKTYSIAEQGGIDMTSELEIGGINKMVNSMTGRGALGRVEGASEILNLALFAVKFFKSNLDVLTAPFKLLSGESTFAKRRAAINTLKIVSGIATILIIANALDDDSVDFSAISANFGKIRAGNMRFDVTGGMSSLVILLARLATQSTKSSVTGITKQFGEGYGSTTGMDAFWNFTENKFSPMFSVVKELVDQKTFEGEKPTVINQLQNLTVPIVIESGIDAYQKEDIANALLVLIADGIGISANVYSYNSNWEVNPGKELIQFKEKVGKDKFKEANAEFNGLVNKKIVELKADEKWKAMSDEDKQKKLLSEKTKIKDKIFRSYRFKYRR